MANIYKNAKADLDSTSEVTLYTSPSNSRAIIKSILLHNDSGSGADISMKVVNASSAEFPIFTQLSTTARSTSQILTEPLILEESEALKCTASVADRLIVIVSILEINKD
jgi:hypothetical protein|tara:strand:- start:295 stop:624 length:330 start_codon:yes stop_codon:yes gene_type:complete